MIFNYHLSDRCDLSCLDCPIHQKDTEEEFPDIGTVGADLRLLRKKHVRILNLTGGDPLLYPHISDVTALAKKLGFYVIVTTPGVHYQSFPDGLKGKVDLFIFLVQGADAAQHDTRTGLVSFSRLLNAVEYAREQGIPAVLTYPVTRDTVQLLPEMYDFAVVQRTVLLLNPLPVTGGVQGFDRPTLEYLMYYGRRPHAWVNMSRIWALKRGYPLEQTACLASDTMLENHVAYLNLRTVLTVFSLFVLWWKMFFQVRM